MIAGFADLNCGQNRESLTETVWLFGIYMYLQIFETNKQTSQCLGLQTPEMLKSSESPNSSRDFEPWLNWAGAQGARKNMPKPKSCSFEMISGYP